MGKDHFQLQEENYTNGDSTTYLGAEYPRKTRCQTRKVIFIVILVCILALILGLGFGLGLQSHDKSSKSSEEVGAESQTTTEIPLELTTRHTSTSWLDHGCPQNDEQQQCPWELNPVLLVSLDGFRAEYLERHKTPVIQKLRECGIKVPYMRSAYPTLTFPNHYTIVTGLYPESHGIVGNNMYDPDINMTFTMGGPEKFDPRWWKGEPLWLTARKQGLKAGSFFWVGSEINISGHHPDYWFPYDGKITYEERVDTVLKWLSWPASHRPDFITLYMDEPDHTGHGHGPDSPEVESMLTRVDSVIGYLMDGLYKRNIHNCVNVIIIADHGMESTSCDRKVNLDTYIDHNKYYIFDGTVGYIHKDYYAETHNKKTTAKRNKNAISTEELLGKLECKSAHYNAFSSRTMPVRHHFTNSKRIGDIVLDVQAKWIVDRTKSSFCLSGNHGYDNLYKSMQALFVAYGPGFKKRLEGKPFENIELYNMMTTLLNITASENNGTKGTLDYMLASTPQQNTKVMTLSPASNTCLQLQKISKQNSDCHCSNAQRSSDSSDWKIPFGQPSSVIQDSKACMWNGTSYLSLYSNKYGSPIWTSFNLNKEKGIGVDDETCIMTDLQIPDTRMNCSDFEINGTKPTLLFQPDSSSVSPNVNNYYNTVPMYPGFRNGIWRYLLRLVNDYRMSHEISVTTGPVFDHNFDGLWDKTTLNPLEDGKIAMPTHFYMILMRCSDANQIISSCNRNNIEVLSFILPHVDKVSNCLPNEDYLYENVARIRDVEIITGLQFLTELSSTDSAPIRTYLPTSIWKPNEIALHWRNLECPVANQKQTCSGKIPLLLISLDGFRADYLNRHITPNIQHLQDCGVHTPYMRSAFPTVTFPNHYTIVTGLYPESHGIISNKMYDEDIGAYFTISSPVAKDPRWWGGEPLWQTVKKFNKTAATYFWPGSDVNISGSYPDEWKKYSGSAGFPERVNVVLDWLRRPDDTRPDFVTLYFDEPDHAGHSQGPGSELVNDKLSTVDAMIGRLMDDLYENNLHSCVNIILLADHGFDDVSCSEVVRLDKYINISNVLVQSGTFGRIQTEFHGPRKHVVNSDPKVPVNEIVDKLMCNTTSAMKVFTKETIPKRLHYVNNKRIGEILLDMQTRWLLATGFYPCTGGNHGWDNIYKSMHALFVANGPAFQNQYQCEPFENIELYNLMSDILGIQPASNNGTKGTLDHILVAPPSRQSANPPTNQCSHTPSKNVTLLPIANSNCSVQNCLFAPEKPWKIGLQLASDYDSCLLFYPKAVVGHDSTGLVFTQFHISNTTSGSANLCEMNDSRQNLSLDDEKKHFIYPIEMLQPVNCKDVHVSTMKVGMIDEFKTGIWKYLWKLVKEYTNIYGNIEVTVGPIYDRNGDGLADNTRGNRTYPTHFFMVLIRCNSGLQPPCVSYKDSVVLSFVLPHVKMIPNCLSEKEHLQENVARVRDIELLTGLTFFTNLNLSDAARLKTFLSIDLWPADMVKSWLDHTCDETPYNQSCSYKPLLLISLDGFRADYLLRNFTPYVRKLSQCGTHAPYMRSVYPTKTFPNHYTIVTGLYPESHGIIDNSMFDADIDSLFGIGKANASDPRWWGGEPIWITANKQNKKTATYFWPGSDVKVQGQYPTYWKKFGDVPFDNRVDQILKWIDLPAGQRPDFLTLYFDEPDHAGHTYGPDDIYKIGLALDRVDEAIGRLMEGLYRRNLHSCVNVIIVADHGMSDTACDRVLTYQDYFTSTYNMYTYEGAFSRINNQYQYKSNSHTLQPVAHPISNDLLRANLSCKSEHMKVFSKETIPKRHHYANNDRIEDIIVDVEDKWLITFRDLKNYQARYCEGGNHGYDNLYKSMQALFLAAGPAFYAKKTIDAFENIELYNLMADVLGISPAPNNGTRGSLFDIMREPPTITTAREVTDYKDSGLQQSNLTQFLDEKSISKCPRECNLPSASVNKRVNESLIKAIHAPFGLPIYTNQDTSLLNISYQSNMITAYHADKMIPLWISYTINNNQSQAGAYPNCVVYGSCKQVYESLNGQKYTWTPLYRKGMDKEWQSYLSINFLPMLDGFHEGMWNFIMNLTESYTQKYGKINFIFGPVFDKNFDGLPDDLRNITDSIPTHLFAIITKCENKTISHISQCQPKSLHTMSFIIPHLSTPTNCQTYWEHMHDNEARIRDVELVTSLQFFTDLTDNQAVKLRTYLPSGLWPTQ